MGKSIPENLIKQIEQDKKNEISEDSYNNFSNNFQDKNQENQSENQQNNKILNMNKNNQYINQINTHLKSQIPLARPHKYSPQYAAYIGLKPKAQTTARLKLGGIY